MANPLAEPVTESQWLGSMDKAREQAKTTLAAHFPVIYHSRGVVCRCQRVFHDDTAWAEHAAEEVIPE